MNSFRWILETGRKARPGPIQWQKMRQWLIFRAGLKECLQLTFVLLLRRITKGMPKTADMVAAREYLFPQHFTGRADSGLRNLGCKLFVFRMNSGGVSTASRPVPAAGRQKQSRNFLSF